MRRRVDSQARRRNHDRMPRRLALAILLCLTWSSTATLQEPGLLRVSVVLTGADRSAMPIRRHLLLISDNPSSAPPRRVFTTGDGTAEVRLRPGNYTVESDRPVAFEGRAYQWTEIVDVVTGQETVLALTAANAEAIPAAPGVPVTSPSSPLEEDSVSLATRWQGSVVEIWTPTAHASGALVDAGGLVVTNQQPIGRATEVEVQVSSTHKVAAAVVVVDAERDLAVVRIDPATMAAVPPLPLVCGEAVAAPAVGDELIGLDAPPGRPKGAIPGEVTRVATRVIESDLVPASGASGGPVFSTRGALLGILSEGDARMRQNGADTRVVRASEVCAVVALARTKVAGSAPPPAARLPVEPATPFPTADLGDVATLLARHPPFQLTSARFEIAVLTPAHVVGGQHAPTRGRSMPIGAAWQRVRIATEFANWTDYVAETPPVVFIRVTPKLVESFWMKVARGAAYTQGVALPAVKRPSSGFARMRAYCGTAELTPIHPFVLEIESGDNETISEGLYAFAPDAFAPACGAVRLEIHAQKDPARADTVAIDAAVLERVWTDFAAFRASR